jgi:hypothetical protein
MGGLGNQLFQILFAIEFCSKNKLTLVINLDWYRKNDHRMPSILKLLRFLDIPISYSISDLKLGPSKSIALLLYRIYQRLMIKIGLRDYFEKYVYLLSNYGYIFNFDNHVHQFKYNPKATDYLIAGYFQSDCYFSDKSALWKNKIIYALKCYCEVSNFDTESINPTPNDIAISCRLGKDYREANDLYLCTPIFYENAVNLFQIKNCRLSRGYVFSDDLEAAKNLNFNLDELYFVSTNDDIHGLFLMTKLRCYVLANSSFSWCGAYLSDYSDKKAFAPSKWYKSETKKSALYNDYMEGVDFEE